MFDTKYAAKLAIKAALPGSFIACPCGCGSRYRRDSLAKHLGEAEATLVIDGLKASAEAARSYLAKMDLR